jgi:predicted NBD/HSP70 family sugar kinase
MAGEGLRRHNLAAVLQRIYLTGPSSRSQITSATGLNRSTVADLVAELVDLELVSEGPGRTTAGPGRPSPIVKVKWSSTAALAIEVSVDSIAVAGVGLGGHVISQRRVSRPRGRFDPHRTIEDLAALARPVLNRIASGGTRLIGTGVAVAGLVQSSQGVVRFAPNLDWREVPIAEMIEAQLRLGAPVIVGNEADLAAVAEFRRGVRPGTRDLIYVSGEVGLGAGIIVDGRLLRGLDGYGGEVGHTMISLEGKRCKCGASGCWETEAGESALLARCGLEDLSGADAVDQVLQKATEGEKATLDAIAETGTWLGLGLGNLVNTFNPELLVLGGLYHRLFPYLEKAATKAMESQAMSAPLQLVTIADTALGIDAPLVGAAELIMTEVLNDPASVAEVGPLQAYSTAR